MTKKMTKTIKKALIENEMTITQLAVKIGRSRVYTSNVINGHFTNPSEETLRRIARAIGMNADELRRAA